jgi:hypothetical protein
MADTHASKGQIPAEKMGDYEGRMQQFGDYYVNFETMPAGTGGPEIFKGLPDDASKTLRPSSSAPRRNSTRPWRWRART